MATREVTPTSRLAQSIPDAPAPNYTRPMAVVTTLFFMWGFITCLNDILVPHLKALFDLSYSKVMLIQFAFFSAYFFFSWPWSKIVNWIGYQKTMVAGLLTMAVGAFLFLPAASIVSYPLFLTALMILGGGITGLQVSANPYVVQLGKPKMASSRMDLTQAFNSLGTTIAPKLGGLLILSAVPLAVAQLQKLTPEARQLYRVQQAASVKMPYTVIGIALLLLAVLIGFSKLPSLSLAANNPGLKITDSIWKHPSLIFAVIGIFAYVGAEVSIGSFLVNYFGLPAIAGLSAITAAGYVSFYWGGAMIGRFVGSALARRMNPRRLLTLCAIVAAALVSASMLLGGHTAMWTILCRRFFQLDHVPHDLHLGRSGTGRADRQWIGHPEHGHRGRRHTAPHPGRNCGPYRTSPRVHSPRALLLVHLVLRSKRIGAE